MVAIDSWGLLDDYCIGTAIKDIHTAFTVDGADMISLLQDAADQINYRIDYIKKNVSNNVQQ